MQWVYTSHLVFILIIILQFIFPEPGIKDLTIIFASLSGILLSVIYCFSILKDDKISAYSSNIKIDKNPDNRSMHKGFFTFLFILYTIFLAGGVFSSMLKTKELHIHNPDYPEFSFDKQYSIPYRNEPDIINERPVIPR